MDRSKKRERERLWRRANKERRNKEQKLFYDKHKDIRLARMKEDYDNPPGKAVVDSILSE